MYLSCAPRGAVSDHFDGSGMNPSAVNIYGARRKRLRSVSIYTPTDFRSPLISVSNSLTGDTNEIVLTKGRGSTEVS